VKVILAENIAAILLSSRSLSYVFTCNKPLGISGLKQTKNRFSFLAFFFKSLLLKPTTRKKISLGDEGVRNNPCQLDHLCFLASSFSILSFSMARVLAFTRVVSCLRHTLRSPQLSGSGKSLICLFRLLN
jgi:hypothetical protein